jgi:hypothetical protein
MEFIIVLYLKDSRFSCILYPADYARTANLIGRHCGTCTSVGGYGAELITLLPGIVIYLAFGLTWTYFALSDLQCKLDTALSFPFGSG